MDTLKIRTTQNVEVEYPIASVGDRILAYLIDAVVCFGWMLICILAFVTLLAPSSPSTTTIVVAVVAAMLPYLFYDLLCEIFMNGQTLGKRAKDIKVIKLNGQSPSVGDYLLRWVFRIIDITFYGIVAIASIVITGKGQRLGDLAAGTSVIKTTTVKRRNPFQVQLEEDYQLVFPEVAALSDQDMALMRKLLAKAIEHQNEALLSSIADRAKQVMGVQTHLTDRDFLKTVIKDYHHLTAGMEA
ncbi:RDD family protein [Rufibacter glacialis]|uniref:RDD family protein n=1 Tax=Rufibacter glacialis TaxID=1259555 RepID=A0A5M8Q2Q9_9BACT|nr:RDD family protein [Rufibacter glacialis]KAA6430177.1 RDD family protein [Rufibacter glacialis]GGK87065.1 RDD family protein [Rufibacter glacialis]